MPNYIFNFFGNDAVALGVQQAFQHMYQEDPLYHPVINSSPEPPTPPMIDHQSRIASAYPSSSMISHASENDPMLLPIDSLMIPNVSHSPLNAEVLSSKPNVSKSSIGHSLPRFLPADVFNEHLTKFLKGKERYIDQHVPNVSSLQLDSLNPFMQMLEQGQNPVYNTSLNAVNYNHHHTKIATKLGSASVDFKWRNSKWTMSIRQNYHSQLKKDIKLSNIVCIFMHSVTNGYDSIESTFLGCSTKCLRSRTAKKTRKQMSKN